MVNKEIRDNIISYSLIGVSVILLFFLIRTFIKSATGKLMTVLKQGQGPVLSPDSLVGREDLNDDNFINQLSPEQKAKLGSRDEKVAQILNYVRKSPRDASKLLRIWISQGEN